MRWRNAPDKFEVIDGENPSLRIFLRVVLEDDHLVGIRTNRTFEVDPDKYLSIESV
jgi:hypothetical protein